jgi:hypothetical protein
VVRGAVADNGEDRSRSRAGARNDSAKGVYVFRARSYVLRM